MRMPGKKRAPQDSPAPRRGVTDYLVLYMKGVAMGGADVVPGVSGGTIALLVGVYMELLESIRNAGSGALLGIFRRGGLLRYWRQMHGAFLLALGLGIATSIFTLASLITHLLEHHRQLVWAFFFGLIAASIILVAKRIRKWTWARALLLVVGVAIGYFVSTAASTSMPDSPLFFFLAGALAICAMILPGISGSFILLLLGKYAAVMEAVHTLNFRVLLPVGAGAVVGILTFSHLLAWLLRRWEHATLALLTGFMGGSIVRVWPWQNHASDAGEGMLWPWEVTAAGGDSQLLWVLLLAVVGMLVVLALERLSSRATQG